MNPNLYTRRKFLKTSILGTAATWTIPAFIETTINTLTAYAQDSAIQTITGKDNPILVLIQLGGGNDGLNTIVPFTNDIYFKERPQLAIPATRVLKLTDDIGFNPELNGIKEIFDQGNLALIQGVGYPNPNRSHFKSTDHWITAGGEKERAGWIGRYFDSCCKGSDPVGISVSDHNPRIFQGNSMSNILSFTDPNEINFDVNPMTSTESLAFFKDLNSGIHSHDEPPLAEFLEKTALDSVLSIDKFQQTMHSNSNEAAYPKTQLGQDLCSIAKLINGEFSTRVYYASQKGYDTHANQAENHKHRLRELDDAITAFVRDLKSHNNFQKVIIMTFSEFGRRVKENGSRGTDHGAAAPMFIMGGNIKPGIFGEHPSLTDLIEGDLKYNIDFRSVYATILQKWLNTNPESILHEKFDQMSFL